jgi:hypothetical protein
MLVQPQNVCYFCSEAANAFYRNVQHRVQASRESRKILKELLIKMRSQQDVPDYEKLVKKMNLRLAEIFYAGDLTAMLHSLYQKLGRPVQ